MIEDALKPVDGGLLAIDWRWIPVENLIHVPISADRQVLVSVAGAERCRWSRSRSIAAKLQYAPRLELICATINAERGRHIGKAHVAGQRSAADLGRKIRVGAKRLEFGSENEIGPGPAPIKWFFADAISCQRHAPVFAIPQTQGKHARRPAKRFIESQAAIDANSVSVSECPRHVRPSATDSKSRRRLRWL